MPHTSALFGAANNPGATTLSNDSGLVPTPMLTTTADASGRYQFMIDAAVGANPLRVVAVTDGFGQASAPRSR